MSLRKGAIFAELIGGICGWIWLLGIIAVPVLALWAIFGEGRWYYVVIAIVVAGFCKSLAREYMKESQKMAYEATGVDYPQEWLGLPDAQKKLAVLTATRAIISKYHPEANLDEWIAKWQDRGIIDDFVAGISNGYKETGLKRPYQVVCTNFIDNYFQSIPKAMEKSLSQ